MRSVLVKKKLRTFLLDSADLESLHLINFDIWLISIHNLLFLGSTDVWSFWTWMLYRNAKEIAKEWHQNQLIATSILFICLIWILNFSNWGCILMCVYTIYWPTKRSTNYKIDSDEKTITMIQRLEFHFNFLDFEFQTNSRLFL